MNGKQKIAEYLRKCPEVEDFEIETQQNNDPILKVTLFLKDINDEIRRVYE